MRDYRDAKVMARALRSGLTDHDVKLTHSQSLELMAKAFGYDNWNILAAKIEAEQPAQAERAATKTLYCSFCGKSQHDVNKLIAGPDSFICDECVGLCNDIIELGALLKLLEEDEAAGAAGYPKLEAFLALHPKERLPDDLARMERDLTRMREGLRTFDDAIEARREGRPLPGKISQDTSDAELAKRRDRSAKEVDGTVKLIDIVTRAIEARG